MEPVRTPLLVTADTPVPLRPAPEPTTFSAARIATAVARGELSASEVVEAHLAHIAEIDPIVRSLVHVDADSARRQARQLDCRVRQGETLGPLAGVPVAVKDNIDVRRQTTASGSRAHTGVMALRDAPAIRRLRAADAVILARANMDEFAMGASTQTSAFGATRNPWDLQRSPGGSSGGSAAAVAANLVPVSIGTDTGGSIREPAAQCGVVGLAPSPGLVSTEGVVPFAPELDRVGPLTRDVDDTARVLAVLSGRDDLARPVADLPALRVGLVHELRNRGNQAGVLERLERVENTLRHLGFAPVVVSIPDAAAGLSAYMSITAAACVPLLAHYAAGGCVGAEFERRWLLGQELLTTRTDELNAAVELQHALQAQARDALAQCDVLLSPTMPTTAPLLRARTADVDDPTARDLADPMHAPYTDCWSVLANLTGMAAISMPAGRSPEDGMPVGVQLAAPAGSDAMLLALAVALAGQHIDAP